jgi:hypothetical protein
MIKLTPAPDGPQKERTGIGARSGRGALFRPESSAEPCVAADTIGGRPSDWSPWLVRWPYGAGRIATKLAPVPECPPDWRPGMHTPAMIGAKVSPGAIG